MGLGPAVAQVGAAKQGPVVELGQAERGPAEQGPAVAQVELGAVAELGPAEQGPVAELGQAERGPVEQGPAVVQVGAAELGAVAELGPSWGKQDRSRDQDRYRKVGRALLTRVNSKQILSYFCRDLQG